MECYEYHLYGTYNRAVNWQLEEYRHFFAARGGQFLYFFAEAPQMQPILKEMLATRQLPYGFDEGGWDTYRNSVDYFYIALMFYFGYCLILMIGFV